MSTVADVTEGDDLIARRREVIATSGWGARFHLLQPRNLCFWLYVAVVAVGGWQVLTMVAPTAGLFAQANIAAVVTSGLFAVAFLVFLHLVDRWERTPALLAGVAFVGGGLGAAFAMALPGNAAMMGLYAKLFGQPFATDWKAGLTAPFVEETAKGAIFLLCLGLAPIVIRTVYDGLLVGAYVGLGFQVLEDMLYGQNAAARAFGAGQVENVLDTFVLRAVTGVASHALYTALFAAGLIYLIGTVAQPRRVGRGLALMVSAMLIHGLWDSAAALAGPWVYVLLIVLTIGAIAALIVAFRAAGGREHSIVRAILAPEVANGTLTEAELDAVAGTRKARRTVAAHPEAGMSKRAERRVFTAARDLAHDLALSSGDDSDQVRHSRGEIARLRNLPH